MYVRQSIALLAIGLCVFSGCGQEEKFVRKANPDFKGNVQRFEDYGFSIKLYPEYKEVANKNNAVCFVPENEMDKKSPKNLAIIFWGRCEDLYKRYSDAAVSNLQDSKDIAAIANLEELGVTDNLIKIYKMDKPCFQLACVLWTEEHKLFKKYNRLRLEVFPKDKKHQITVVMKGDNEDMNKLLDMAESIEAFQVKRESVKKQ